MKAVLADQNDHARVEEGVVKLIGKGAVPARYRTAGPCTTAWMAVSGASSIVEFSALPSFSKDLTARTFVLECIQFWCNSRGPHNHNGGISPGAVRS